MTRGDFFLLCVQTFVLKEKLDAKHTVQALHAASQLDEAAYGGEKNLAQAAQDFVRWNGAMLPFIVKKPEWLMAWEEARQNRVRVAFNEDARAGLLWWQHAAEAANDSVVGRGLPLPAGMERLVSLRSQGGVHAMTVSRSDAQLFRDWGAAIPGWEEEPFTFSEVVD